MSYSNYDFCLYWEDLSEDFRNEKIDQIIEKRTKEDWDFGDKNSMTVAELQEDQEVREEVENWITAHFPVYF